MTVTSALGARDLFRMVRSGIDVNAVNARIRKPFRILLCGEPALVAELRTLLLSGHAEDAVPVDAAACLETIGPGQPLVDPSEARVVVLLGRRGDAAGANLNILTPLHLPIMAITIDPIASPSGPPAPPGPSSIAQYVAPAITREGLRPYVFPHLVRCVKGAEIAVGRRLPALRETVASRLTRDAAATTLKIALASAVVDHVPVVGVVLGAFASAGDTVAITAIQMMLLLNIEAAYGSDPDFGRMWRLLPVIGGGLGWRTVARELSGFIPVAGVAIKGAIAYAGTIVVGEGVTFFHEHGSHMNSQQAKDIYERTKRDALQFARDLAKRKRND